MKKGFIKLIILSGIILGFGGCTYSNSIINMQKQSNTLLTINDATVALADQLSQNSKLNALNNGTIAAVSFVDLKNLNETSQFGRILSESLYNELFIRDFKLTDVRGQNVITINPSGEFYLSRDTTHLNKEVSNTYILVGTYSCINENITINARILDNKTGKLLSSGRVIYTNDDYNVSGVCSDRQRKIKIVSDDYMKKSNSSKQLPQKIIF